MACEYSGRVRDAFIARGHDAVSCDLLPTDVPGPHYQGDVRDILGEHWDLMVCHPPCTYLTCAAEWAYKDPDFERYPGVGYHQRLQPGTLFGAERRAAREEALKFIELLWNARIKRKCAENPNGVIRTRLPWMPKPQVIHPHMFGDNASKATCLFLDDLPPLVATDHVPPRITKDGKKRWANQTDSGQNKLPPTEDRWKIRSETYPGIAAAMAEQWG